MGQPILAQYTICSKQEYIYRTNRIVEIMGASVNISNAWEGLFEQAEKSALIVQCLKKGEQVTPFCMSDIQEAFKQKKLHLVEMFRGGGNTTVLYDSIESYKKANGAFSYYLLKEYPGMIPMCVCYKVTGDYKKDYQHLMEQAEIEKNRMISGQDEFILPFSMMDRDTFQPYSVGEYVESKLMRFSEESKSKRRVGIDIRNNDKAVRLLDEMVTKRGEESLLAVVHADGNNMRSKIMDLLKDEKDYDSCVNYMRVFTTETANAFTECGLKAIKACQAKLREKYPKLKESAFLYRKVIADGDDITFICNARFVMEYVKAYLEAVQSYQKEHHLNWSYSSCAGICIFHSHYPFARAYALAEQACDEGAKQKVHVVDENGKQVIIEEGWVDFHYIHNGIGGDLRAIRERQGTAECMGRPWRLTGGRQNEIWSYERLLRVQFIFKKYNVSRSDIKTLGGVWEDSFEEGYKELRRVYGHHKGLQSELENIFPEQSDLMKAIYDLSEVYDLWFREA